MPRYAIAVEYDGTPFVGWQRQENGRSIQQALEEAAERLSGAPTRMNGAGRTDAGVHALGQVAHVDFAKAFPADTVRDALNAHLRPEPVAVLAAALVDDSFDARHCAHARHYRYRIANRRPPPAIDRNVWHVPPRLNAEAMAAGAAHLLGRHDFTTFRSAKCQATSALRTLDRLDVWRENDTVVIEASARSFLHNQVRSMVGSLVEVGVGRWSPQDMARALAAASRTACGPVAPAVGLFLTSVDYGDPLWT